MRRLHAARNLDWQLHTDGDLHLRAEQTDLEEMLGNLLDNAALVMSCAVAKQLEEVLA